MTKSHSPTTPLPTPNETLVLQCIWRDGPLTVREIRDRLMGHKPLAYTTVLTIANVLNRKGWLDRRREGRADVYRCTVGQAQTQQIVLEEIAKRFFDGSREKLLASARKTPMRGV